MSRYGDYIKSVKEKDAKWFFGDDAEIGNNHGITWKRYKDDDNIVLVTNNVSYWSKKGTYVMWVGNNKIVYLKDWQVRPVKNWELGALNAYAVRLTRKYFKPYALSFSSDEFMFEKDESFDDLVEVAKSQDQDPHRNGWKTGHYDC